MAVEESDDDDEPARRPLQASHIGVEQPAPQKQKKRPLTPGRARSQSTPPTGKRGKATSNKGGRGKSSRVEVAPGVSADLAAPAWKCVNVQNLLEGDEDIEKRLTIQV